MARIFCTLNLDDRHHYLAWFRVVKELVDEAAEKLKRQEEIAAKRREAAIKRRMKKGWGGTGRICLLYTSDAADE